MSSEPSLRLESALRALHRTPLSLIGPIFLHILEPNLLLDARLHLRVHRIGVGQTESFRFLAPLCLQILDNLLPQGRERLDFGGVESACQRRVL